MYRVMRRIFRALPTLQPSLEQDYHNPIQTDRLPDTSSIELEVPVVDRPFQKNVKTARWYLLLAFCAGWLVALIAYFDTFTLSLYLTPLLMSIGCVLVVLGYFSARQSRWRWPVFVVILPHLILAVFYLEQPLLVLVISLIATVFVADLFATHFFHLHTTAPLDRERAKQLRGLWRKRLLLNRSVSGAELYLFILLIALLLPFLLVWGYVVNPPKLPLENLPRFLLVAVLLLLLPVACELIAMFLYARNRVRFQPMATNFFSAVTHWLTYNQSNISAPGAFRTPAGDCKHRCRMSLGLVILISAAITQLVNRYEVPLEYANETVESNETHRQESFPLAGTKSRNGVGEQGLNSLSPISHLPDNDHPRPLEPSSDELSSPSTSSPILEPYQERMLERMSAEEQQEYLEELRMAQETQQDNPDEDAGQSNEAEVTKNLTALAEEDVDSFTQALGSMYLVVITLGYPMVLAALAMLLVLASAFATTGRLVGHYGNSEHLTEAGLIDSDHWDHLVERIQSSDNPTERTSLLLGYNAFDNTPVLVPKSVFAEHAHLLGDSGSGKTSIGIASIISQLVRPGDCSVVVLDLKADDLAMFHGMKKDAKRAGLRFRWFTNQLGHSTYGFNPLAQVALTQMSAYQKTDMLTASMGLQYGRDYGRAYYADANAQLLYTALREFPEIDSFRNLSEVLASSFSLPNIDTQVRRAASHLTSIVHRLADSEPLNVTANAGYDSEFLSHCIEFSDLFREPQVVHFHLSSTLGTTSSAEIARIALYSLITAASQVSPEDRVQTFVVIDEFQRVVAGNMELFLQLARSLNIGVILANQSLMDLRTAGTNLVPAISANTRFRQIFAASNLEEQERLVRGSGESLTYSQSWNEYLGTFGPGGIDGRNLSEFITPRLRINDILLATDHPQQSIVQIRRGAGYAQYGGMTFVMRSAHPISLEEYQTRKKTPWPEESSETITPSMRDFSPEKGLPTLAAKRRGDDLFVDSEIGQDLGSYLEELYQRQQDDSPAPEAGEEA